MAAPDDYESKYMGGGEALARSRVGWPWWFHAIMGTSGAFLILSAIASSTLVPLLSLPILAVVWLLLMFLRVTVTTEHVHVQLGLFGPKIPIAKLVSAKAEDYQPLKYGGWGIRLGRDGSWAYSMPGSGGRGVRLTYETEGGKKKEVFVSTNDPEAVLAGIAKARAGIGVRVADEVRVEEARDPVAEAEADPEAGEKKA
ncbi:MAG TPA: hypothetical protein VF316_24785 [Polyangiaceae bacterium]